MNQYGKITAYDAERGVGMIAPERGGDALPFRKADLQQQDEELRSDQLYTFDMQEGLDGQPRAINLQMEQSRSAGQTDNSHGGFSAQGQSEQQANQQAASRPGVDAQNHGDSGESQHGGSTFQPLESDESKHGRTPQQQHDLGRDALGQDEHRS